MQITLQLLIALVGLLIFLLATKADVKEIGRIMFFSGLFAFLLTGAGPLITLLGGPRG